MFRFDGDARQAVAKRKQAKAPSTRDAGVHAYVNRLKSVGLRRPEFEAVVADLTADKSARKSEVVGIASQYVGVSLRSRSRGDALKVIEKRFLELARFERKQEIA